MTHQHTTTVALVSSGDTLSDVFSVVGASGVGIHAPALTSGTALVLGALDEAGPFRRASDVDGSDFVWNVAAGSRHIYSTLLRGATWARVELSSAQTAPRSLSILLRP